MTVEKMTPFGSPWRWEVFCFPPPVLCTVPCTFQDYMNEMKLEDWWNMWIISSIKRYNHGTLHFVFTVGNACVKEGSMKRRVGVVDEKRMKSFFLLELSDWSSDETILYTLFWLIFIHQPHSAISTFQIFPLVLQNVILILTRWCCSW